MITMSDNKPGIWNYFVKLDKDNAKCKICKRSINFESDETVLAKHLEESHQDETINYESDSSADTKESTPNKHTPKKRKSRNPLLWEYFTKVTDEFALCNHCKKKLSYRSTTNNLAKHLLYKHEIDIGIVSTPHPRKRRPKQTEEDEERIVTNVSEFFESEDGAYKCMVCDEHIDDSDSGFYCHMRDQHAELLPNNDDPHSEIILIKEELPRQNISRHYSTPLPVPRNDHVDTDEEISTFIRYLTFLVRSVPKKYQTKLQMDLLKVVMDAKMAADSDGDYEESSCNPLK